MAGLVGPVLTGGLTTTSVPGVTPGRATQLVESVQCRDNSTGNPRSSNRPGKTVSVCSPSRWRGEGVNGRGGYLSARGSIPEASREPVQTVDPEVAARDFVRRDTPRTPHAGSGGPRSAPTPGLTPGATSSPVESRPGHGTPSGVYVPGGGGHEWTAPVVAGRDRSPGRDTEHHRVLPGQGHPRASTAEPVGSRATPTLGLTPGAMSSPEEPRSAHGSP